MAEEVIDLGDEDSSVEMDDTNTANANESIRFVQLSLEDVREEIDEEPTKQEEFTPEFTYVFFFLICKIKYKQAFKQTSNIWRERTY